MNKLLCVFIAAALLLSGCGGKDNKKDKGDLISYFYEFNPILTYDGYLVNAYNLEFEWNDFRVKISTDFIESTFDVEKSNSDLKIFKDSVVYAVKFKGKQISNMEYVISGHVECNNNDSKACAESEKKELKQGEESIKTLLKESEITEEMLFEYFIDFIDRNGTKAKSDYEKKHLKQDASKTEPELKEEAPKEEAPKEEAPKEEAPKEEVKPTISTGQRNALKSAKDYLIYSAFSYSGLVEQLKFEGYTDEETIYAADNCGSNWNEQAAKSAKSYLEFSSFSRQGLIEQLLFEGFTQQQAEYGVTAAGY